MAEAAKSIEEFEETEEFSEIGNRVEMRSIRDIVKDLSKPVAKRHLARPQTGRQRNPIYFVARRGQISRSLRAGLELRNTKYTKHRRKIDFDGAFECAVR